jgi:50S ribosomal protein L16 3-hydroxylase
MKKMTLLGGLTAAQFLRDYWHKKPLLIRQAIPDFKPLLSRDALFDMAASDEVESRLITHFKRQWRMEKGPVTSLPSVMQRDWTLLVQGVNLHDEAADRLLRQFRFIPDARLDDLMISFATDAGGVGPHFDSYDVFLLQAQGQRRWRISAQQDLSMVEDMPLKILRHFQPEQEFLLEPGDMLYLPPHYAHEGTAIGECMTYSIGFRAPSYQELGEAFLHFLADSIELDGRYADPDLVPSTHPAEISRAMLSKISAQLHRIRFDESDIAIFLGEFLSEPKPNVFFNSPTLAWTFARFTKAAFKRGIRLSPKSNMLYRQKHLFINGESFVMERKDRKLLTELADMRSLDGPIVATASEDVLEALHAWYQDGWILLAQSGKKINR